MALIKTLNELNSTKSFNKMETNSSPIGNRYKNLFLSQKYTDCSFTIGQTYVNCHKLILSAASPVFEAMFYGPMKEEKSIEILDISPDCFYHVINYIYAGEINLEKHSLEKTIEIYYCAEKYLLFELILRCLNSIKTKLTFQNILQALDFSVNTNLDCLTQICMEFFNRFCLNNFEFIKYIETKYYHVTKDCIKAIIETIPKHKHLLWLIVKWAQNETEYMGLTKEDCETLLTNEFKIDNSLTNIYIKDITPNLSNLVERTTYKACRPFIINFNNNEHNFVIKTNRFICLYGVVLNSRLIPQLFYLNRTNGFNMSDCYEESLIIEISTGLSRDIIHRHQMDKHRTHYNSNLNIIWNDEVILQPLLEYQFKLIWPHSEFGAEYPCSFQSNEVDGITFKETNTNLGSIVKGLRLIDSL